MFPWQSGSDGREETPDAAPQPAVGPVDAGRSAAGSATSTLAVAYNVWQYYQATGDAEFLVDYGAELILEIARFWAEPRRATTRRATASRSAG